MLCEARILLAGKGHKDDAHDLTGVGSVRN
jgi:hypothetical protein